MAKPKEKKKKLAPVATLSGTRVCTTCGRELPIAHFSTLPRYAAQGVDARDCTYCAWTILVTHRASYEVEGDGYKIVMRPREKLENIDIFGYVWKALPRWAADEAIQHRYSGIGTIAEQIAPFEQFYADVKGKTVNREAFVYGMRNEIVPF